MRLNHLRFKYLGVIAKICICQQTCFALPSLKSLQNSQWSHRAYLNLNTQSLGLGNLGVSLNLHNSANPRILWFKEAQSLNWQLGASFGFGRHGVGFLRWSCKDKLNTIVSANLQQFAGFQVSFPLLNLSSKLNLPYLKEFRVDGEVLAYSCFKDLKNKRALKGGLKLMLPWVRIGFRYLFSGQASTKEVSYQITLTWILNEGESMTENFLPECNEPSHATGKRHLSKLNTLPFNLACEQISIEEDENAQKCALERPFSSATQSTQASSLEQDEDELQQHRYLGEAKSNFETPCHQLQQEHNLQTAELQSQLKILTHEKSQAETNEAELKRIIENQKIELHRINDAYQNQLKYSKEIQTDFENYQATQKAIIAEQKARLHEKMENVATQEDIIKNLQELLGEKIKEVATQEDTIKNLQERLDENMEDVLKQEDTIKNLQNLLRTSEIEKQLFKSKIFDGPSARKGQRLNTGSDATSSRQSRSQFSHPTKSSDQKKNFQKNGPRRK